MGMDTRAIFFCYDVPTSFVREIFYDRGNCPLFGAVEFKVSEWIGRRLLRRNLVSSFESVTIEGVVYTCRWKETLEKKSFNILEIYLFP